MVIYTLTDIHSMTPSLLIEVYFKVVECFLESNYPCDINIEIGSNPKAQRYIESLTMQCGETEQFLVAFIEDYYNTVFFYDDNIPEDEWHIEIFTD